MRVAQPGTVLPGQPEEKGAQWCLFFLLVKAGKAVERDKAGRLCLRRSGHSFLFSHFQVVTEFGDQRLRVHRRPALPYDEAIARVKERR